MMKNIEEVMQLVEMENFLEYNKSLETKDKTFDKLMFIYSLAVRELETKINIFKDEFEVLYNYNLIDNIKTRIKGFESIVRKMEKRNVNMVYKEMIKNVNDIAGIRIICHLKNDIFSIKNLIQKLPGVNVIKEKDYVTYPKESGYSSYHMIVEVPVMLSQKVVYVKVEIQIRTITMDFWASLEHNVKYKPENKISKKDSKEWINCAKMLNKLDDKMIILNNK